MNNPINRLNLLGVQIQQIDTFRFEYVLLFIFKNNSLLIRIKSNEMSQFDTKTKWKNDKPGG